MGEDGRTRVTHGVVTNSGSRHDAGMQQDQHLCPELGRFCSRISGDGPGEARAAQPLEESKAFFPCLRRVRLGDCVGS